jgi:hypothetical protein
LFTRRVRQDDPRLLERMDPGWWDPAYDRALQDCVLSTAPLGDFIRELSYGPIVTGHPSGEPGNLPVVDQGQIAATGLDLRAARRVAAGGPWDAPRARVAPGDLFMCRSGVAGVARGRLVICVDVTEAVVGSFVNRIAVSGVSPVWVMLALRSPFMQAQVQRAINGVGTPNISFDETRALLLPLAPEAAQARLQQAWVDQVHAPHLRWLSGEETALIQATAAAQALQCEAEGLITAGAAEVGAGTPVNV